MDLFDDDPILSTEPDELEVLHDREYRVRAYRTSDQLLLIRGAVRDQKPPGLYLDADPDPLTIHHMQVELDVVLPTMAISRAEVVFESHPHEMCVDIAPHYGGLVGLSIARGFTHRVRELFGGPRGCTHTTALLQAMAPVAIQCIWSMQASAAKRRSGDAPRTPPSRDEMRAVWRSNLNTCHVWDEDGAWVAELESGVPMPAPVFVRDRLEQLGIDETEWQTRMRG